MSHSPDPERRDLDRRVLAWMGEEGWRHEDARFEALALELFAFQFARCTPYARFCEGRGALPSRVTSWREIPPVPTGAFKELALRSFPARRTVHTFRTSGTTGTRRGELHLDTLELYETSLCAAFRRHLLPDLDDLGGRIVMRVLAPSPTELPDSSLSHMFGSVLESWGAPGSGFDVVKGTLEATRLMEALQAPTRHGRPVLLCGTALAFAHLLDALPGESGAFALPPSSRIMETGGFKGMTRQVPREELHLRLQGALGVPGRRIVNQYGMSELGSQFYDSTLRHPDELRRKLGPPWTRVRVVDPESGRDVPAGETGMLVIVDLANTGSILAIQTADLGRQVGDGFEIDARAAGAEARGCSIAADEMLGGRSP